MDYNDHDQHNLPALSVAPGELIKKSNALARARWTVGSVLEPRIIAAVASRVRVEDEHFQTHTIPVQEILGDGSGGHYRDLLKKAVNNLMSAIISIETEKGWKKYNYLSFAHYDSEAATLSIRFDQDLKPHYLGLRRQFTLYSRQEYLSLHSTYSQKIFELLSSWADKPEMTKDLRKLMAWLEVPPSLERYPDFRREVLDRAHREISSTTSLSFTWEAIKQGRKVVAIRFIFSKLRQNEAEAKAKVVQDHRESAAKNTLFLAATKCLGERGGTCEGQEEKEECSACMRV